MIPRTLSASSLAVAEKCMRRWKAEYMDRVPGVGGTAASLGTTCHAALEDFVQRYIKTGEWDWDVLEIYYQASFSKIFGFDRTVPEYADGLNMLHQWYRRTDLSDRTVISCEKKESFEVPSSEGKIKFNYIIDRLDQISETVYEVVDYKSQRFAVSESELGNKIQAKAYALAVQIKYPHATRIWVTFDLLRHGRVSVSFTKEDNKATWAYLKAIAQSIVDTPETRALPSLNNECRFCVVKASCSKFTASTVAGGSLSIDSPDAAAAKMYEMKALIDAAGQLKDELAEYLMKYAAEYEITDWESEDGKYSIAVGHGNGRRSIIDQRKLVSLIPEEVLADYGKLGVTEVDTILKSGVLDKATASAVRKLISRNPGNLGVTVKAK